VLYAIVVAGSLQIIDRSMRRIFVGFLSSASLVSMFASPLFIIVSFISGICIRFSINGTSL
jgi:solute carrier family 50 protein (sugar transporter)